MDTFVSARLKELDSPQIGIGRCPKSDGVETDLNVYVTIVECMFRRGI